MKKKTFLFSSFIEGTKLGQTVLDISLLKKLWTPLIKVKLSHHSFLIISNLQIRHVKSSSTDVGLSYGGRGIGIVNNGGIAMLQYWEPTRAEISCPMDFWNYPFDTQFCHFILEPLNWDFQLVNSPYLKSSQLDDQNIKMSYDIEIVPLPPDLLVRHPDPVSFSCLYISSSHLFCRQNVLNMLEALYPDVKDFKVKTVGFTYKLTRKYSKFIFIYYIPR